MLHIGGEILAAYVMLDHIRRQQHAVAPLGGELAHHEVLRQVVLEPIEAAHLVKYGFASGDRRAKSELHPLEQAGH